MTLWSSIAPRTLSSGMAFGAVGQFVGGIEDLEDASAGGDGALDHVVDPGQGLDRAEQPPPVGAEHEQLAEGEAAGLVTLGRRK